MAITLLELLRRLAGFSLEELSKKTGLSISMLSLIEDGQRKITPEFRKVFLDVLLESSLLQDQVVIPKQKPIFTSKQDIIEKIENGG